MGLRSMTNAKDTLKPTSHWSWKIPCQDDARQNKKRTDVVLMSIDQSSDREQLEPTKGIAKSLVFYKCILEHVLLPVICMPKDPQQHGSKVARSSGGTSPYLRKLPDTSLFPPTSPTGLTPDL